MKKVLIVNGSPKGPGSNTWQMAMGLVRGLEREDAQIIDTLTLRDMDIHSCIGCMSCWGQTAGRCVINDCMQKVHKQIMEADIIIESFPLYFFGMPGPMKVFQDRCMPLMETYRGTVKTIGSAAFHSPRFDMDGKHLVVVSSCGYGSTKEIYDSLIKQFDFIAGHGNYTMLTCPQSEMFAIPKMKPRIDEYLKRYEEIGEILGRGDEVPDELVEKASEPILPQRPFEALVNHYWDSVTPEELREQSKYPY